MSSRIKGAPWISLTTVIVLSIVLTVVRVGDAEGKVLFSDDFESGNLGQWEVIGGGWKVTKIEGNRVAETKVAVDGDNFRTLNITDQVFSDFTIEARIWQVSQDHGANIYFRNNQSRRNPQQHSGYWFGISGALAAVGWGTFEDGVQSVIDVQFSDVQLDSWVRLKLDVKGRSAVMWIQRGGVDDEFQNVFEVDNLFEVTRQDYPKGSIGFVVAGAEVRIDDVVISDDGKGLAIEPVGKTAVLWGQLKGSLK